MLERACLYDLIYLYLSLSLSLLYFLFMIHVRHEFSQLTFSNDLPSILSTTQLPKTNLASGSQIPLPFPPGLQNLYGAITNRQTNNNNYTPCLLFLFFPFFFQFLIFICILT